MAVDWLKIKTEYINDPSTSYRKLSQKYGVSTNSICKKSKEEDWNEKRRRKLDSTCTAVVQKTIDKMSDAMSDEAAAKARIKASMMRLAEGWFVKQEEFIAQDPQKRGINPSDFRKMVQSCIDLGVLDAQESEEYSDDGLLEALGKNAGQLFDDGDDSDILPEEEEGDEDA